METAVARNPYNLNIAASLGFFLMEAGEFEQAQAIMESVIAKTERAAEWWYYTLFTAAMVNEDEAAAIAAANAMTTSTASHYLAPKIIAAHLEGDVERRAAYVAQLRKMDTRFTRDPRQFYGDRLPEKTAERLVNLLEESGYEVQR
jgi:predicted Zn-dependent protease